MNKPARSPWPFQDLAFRLAPVLIAFLGWHVVWNAAVPPDPTWATPPRERTVLTIGVFKTATDAPQANGYDYETVEGRHLRLRCQPAGATPDDCLGGGGRVGDHAGRYATVRYYERPAGPGGPARLVMLGAKSGADWLLRPEAQKASLTARAEGERARKVHVRTAISAALTLAIGFVALLLVRRFKR